MLTRRRCGARVAVHEGHQERLELDADQAQAAGRTEPTRFGALFRLLLLF